VIVDASSFAFGKISPHLRELPARDVEHRLRGRVRERDPQRLAVEHEHDRRQRFEPGKSPEREPLVFRQSLGLPRLRLDQILQSHRAYRRAPPGP
jgi:hypothetical protein